MMVVASDYDEPSFSSSFTIFWRVFITFWKPSH